MQDGCKHVAIIMDGNRRWAKQQGWVPTTGHTQGATTFREVVQYAANNGIQSLTAFAFSTENRKRSVTEVTFLMKLLERMIRKEEATLVSGNIRFRAIGDLEALSSSMRAALADMSLKTAANTGMHLVLAINYGGRDEIVRATRSILKAGLKPGELSEEVFASYLDTAGLTDPDLVIRTSGELRLSNFMLWQLAYAEIYISPKLWPDFTASDFQEALESYKQRNRRKGQ